MHAVSTAILYLAICSPSAFADTSLRGQSKMFETDESRNAQDLSLLTDLQIQPTAIDVAVLQTLLNGAGPLLLGSLGSIFGRSLFSGEDNLRADTREAQDLGLLTDLQIQPTSIDVAVLQTLLGSPFGRSVLKVDESDSVEAVDKERVVYETAAVVTSVKALIAGPAIAALWAGPVVKSLFSVGKIVAGHPLVAISALLGLVPAILGPSLKVLLAGPALLPVLGLLKALKLGVSMAAPAIACAAFAALFVGPAISAILPGLAKLMGKIMPLLPLLLPLFMSGPFGPLVAALAPLVAPLVASLSAFLTGPGVTSFVTLIRVLLSGKTLLPLERNVRALPIKLATAVAEANEYTSSNAFELLNSHKN
ncbi:MAG: hypothetical protein KVP17_004792 [Porospora cf. gigantea B]|nr:MAG: hypothetical protein KVP17_004792 [Porospora cf. gigantea B]